MVRRSELMFGLTWSNHPALYWILRVSGKEFSKGYGEKDKGTFKG
jgi:hypothetical protein